MKLCLSDRVAVGGVTPCTPSALSWWRFPETLTFNSFNDSPYPMGLHLILLVHSVINRLSQSLACTTAVVGMVAIGSLLFCDACGNLLPRTTGHAEEMIPCEDCG